MNTDASITEKDIDTIKAQISAGRVNAKAVLCRCVFGHPAVILLDHKDTGAGSNNGIDCMSASNPLWLTCPHLNDIIHEFENRGYIKKLEGLIYSSEELAGSMDKSHVNFYYFRKRVCGDLIDKCAFDQKMMRIFNSGVGGIRSLSNLKCLHLHYAHYLIDGTNPAGRITERLLDGRCSCQTERCADGK